MPSEHVRRVPSLITPLPGKCWSYCAPPLIAGDAISSGLEISIVPIRDASGHSAATAGSRCSSGSAPLYGGQNCALVQVSSPSAAPGDSVIPGGREKARFLSAGVARVLASLVCALFSANVIAVGWPAWVVPSSEGALCVNSASGENLSFSHPEGSRNDSALSRPVRPTRAGLSATVPGSSHERPSAFQTCASVLEHFVGFDRSGLVFAVAGAQ